MSKKIYVLLSVLAAGLLSAGTAGAEQASAPVAVSSASAQPDRRSNAEKLADPDPIVRRNAAIMLGAEHRKANSPVLLKALDDENVDVVRAAVNALAGTGDPKVVQPLVKKFQRETNIGVRMNIIIALGEIRSTLAVPLLRTLLKDPYPVFRSEAVRALGKINAPETHKDIVAMLGDEAEGVRVLAADAAGTLKIRNAVPGLIKNLKDPVPAVRRAQVRALGLIGDQAAIPELEPLTGDPDALVASAAKIAVEQLRQQPQQGAPKPARK